MFKLRLKTNCVGEWKTSRGYLGTELTCLSQCGLEYFVMECLELFLIAYSKEMRV